LSHIHTTYIHTTVPSNMNGEFVLRFFSSQSRLSGRQPPYFGEKGGTGVGMG
jgi:hypothetical protein